MNKIVSSFYKRKIRFSLKCIEKSLDLHIVLSDHLQKNKGNIQKFKETGDS